MPDKFVSVFNEALLPGIIGVSEEHFGVQHLCDVFVIGELGSVVGGNGKDMPFKRTQKLHDKTSDSLGVLASVRLGHEEFLCGAFDQSNNGALSVLADDGVHLPVAFSFFAYTAHWWTDTEGSLAAAIEEMPAGYDALMKPVIDNIPMLIVALVVTIPVAILGMRLAERILKKRAEGLE